MSVTLRLGLTVPGAVALGAYEAGAVAAVVVAVDGLTGAGADVVLDAVGASSAGAITALLAARCLLEAIDPVSTLRTAWVTEARISALLASGTAAPLSMEPLRTTAAELLKRAGGTERPGQQTPVTVSVGLTNLRGLAYRLPSVTSPGHRVVTHLDWVDLRIERGMPFDALVTPAGGSPVDVVLASAANPLGFPPVLVDRHAARAAYAAAGVSNLPPDGWFWCSDPAPLMREPIGQTLRLARALDADATEVRRAHLIVEPQPLVPDSGAAWADPSAPPDWLDVLRRVAGIVFAQSVYADLAALEKTNLRVARVAAAGDRLAEVVDELPTETRKRLLDALETDSAASSQDPSGEGGTGDRLRAAMQGLAGVTGKVAVSVDVISPRSIDPDANPDALLAGETLARFGGFLDERLRQSDFDLGWRSTLAWLRSDRLASLGVAEQHRAAALSAVADAYPLPEGQPAAPRLRVRSCGDLARLAMRVARVALHDLRRTRR